MKAATGELNLTLITIIALGAILAFWKLLWPQIQEKIQFRLVKLNSLFSYAKKGIQNVCC